MSDIKCTDNVKSWARVDGLSSSATAFPAVAKIGDLRVVILDTGNGLRGVELACPHMKAPMSNGIMMGQGTMVRCPKHNFIFRLSDGKGVNCVGLNLKVYEVRRDGDGVEVLV
ncbi:MAG: hypothetical protein EPN76_00035 [Burkholderiaceae bacterium]|uniref:Rieske (2Fe-2S) protein n=1 Tax=Pandoraea sp. TaxID=1883445 RepID=UPI001207B153|nr:Rieske 2Fe-2S domain-containing protein [Pandoraea sp.]TAL80110.1 MAG: hypothetical protein EPN76_00035 [Burkholderiaceae bacterium]TAM13975.1 MAG: hypothetical protein EPN65_22105 [Pandoraea sp.]